MNKFRAIVVEEDSFIIHKSLLPHCSFSCSKVIIDIREATRAKENGTVIVSD